MKTLFEGKKLYAVIIALLLIITFFITFHIIRVHYNLTLKDTIAENTLNAHLLSSLIYEHQKAAIGILESYAQRPLFVDAVKKKDFHRALSHLKSLRGHHTEIDALFITDKSGTLWANYPVDRTGFGKNLVYRDWYKGVSKKWSPYISSVYRLIVLEKGLAIAVSVPVFDGKGNIIGILGGAQRTAFLAAFIEANILNQAKSITLLDQEGNIIFSNTIGYQEDITKYPDAHVLEKAVARVIADMEIADAKEKGGISYISIAPVRGIGWSVIVGQEKKAILKSLSGYFTRSAAIGFVIFFFLTFCLFYFRREYKYAKAKEIIQAEEKCRNIIENAAEGIFQTTPEGLYISVNPALARMFGYESPEELISTITDVGSQIYAYSEDRDKAVELMRKYGFIKDYNVRCRRKNGSLIWVSFNVHIVRDDQGSILYHEGTSQDITDRKQTEEALRQSEENFRQSFDNSPMGVRIVTREGETIYANRAILDIYGYDSIEEIRTTPAKKRYTPESHADFLIRREKREQGIDVPSEYTINIIRKDGEVRCLLVLRREILWDGERQFQVIYQDITDRKLVEEDLRASEEKYRAVVEDLTELICRFLPGGTLTFVNDAYCRYFGKDKTALVGSSFLSLIPEEDQQAIARMQALISKESPIVTHEHRVILSDGQVLWQQWTNRGIYDGQNHLLEYQAVGRDITERKRAEDNFQVSQQQLRALAKRLQQIREEDRIAIAREIHDEMGGGLTGLKMDLSWLLRKMSNADSGKERVALMDKIHTSNVLIDHMIRVVRRISAHLRPSVLDDLGLIAALEWQLSEFTSRTEIPHELTTTFEYVNMEEATTIAVFRIFQEALTNVARHSRATKVVVDLREGERSLFGDESFVLEIRDNGKGITEEEILNPGSLGLLGMKERVLTFGGELSIRGEPGGGTALVLKIPRKQGETI